MPSLITLAEMKTALGIPVTDLSQDTYLTSLADAASEVIALYLRRHLDSVERTEILHQYGDCLRLRGFPVSEVKTILADGEEVTDYQLKADSGLLYRAGGWPKLPLGYTITYTGGLGSPYPKILGQATLMLVTQMKTTADQGGQAAASERLGDYSISYLGARSAAGTAAGLEAINPAAAALLRVYMGGTL